LIEKVERNMFWIGLYPIRQLKKSINLSGKGRLILKISSSLYGILSGLQNKVQYFNEVYKNKVIFRRISFQTSVRKKK